MVVEDLGLELDTRLFLWETDAEVHLDSEQASVEVGHGSSEIGYDPDKGVLVVEKHIVGHVAPFERLDNLLKLVLKVHGNGGLAFLGIQALLGPSQGLNVDGGLDSM